MKKIKDLKDLNLYDDFLFSKVMDDTGICREMLELILDVPIKKVKHITTQRTIDNMPESKGVKLDVYLNDTAGSVYDVEMEHGKKDKKRSLPKRTRYYQGAMDMDLIAKGADYVKLKKSFVIFICTFDPFGKGRYIYTFENICKEDKSVELDDEAVKIFLNTRGRLKDVDDELIEFLKYVENTTDEFSKNSSSKFVRTMQKRVNKIKASKEAEVEYMTLLMRDKENIEEGVKKGLRKGRKEGRKEGIIYMAKQLLASGKLSVDEIASASGLTTDEIKALKSEQ